MAVEISAAKRERDFYLQQVAKNKALQAMEERRQKRRAADGEAGRGLTDGNTGAAAEEAEAKAKATKVRPVGQRSIKKGSGDGTRISSGLLNLLAGRESES